MTYYGYWALRVTRLNVVGGSNYQAELFKSHYSELKPGQEPYEVHFTETRWGAKLWAKRTIRRTYKQERERATRVKTYYWSSFRKKWTPREADKGA